jgi:hypothetical protein
MILILMALILAALVYACHLLREIRADARLFHINFCRVNMEVIKAQIRIELAEPDLELELPDLINVKGIK